MSTLTSHRRLLPIWIGGNGNWSTATDWTPSGSPNNGANTYNVTINTGNDYVNVNVASTITSLTLGGTAGGPGSSFLNSSSGHALTITGGLIIGGSGYLY